MFEKDITGYTNIWLTIIVISAVCLSEVCGQLKQKPLSVNYTIGNSERSIILSCESTTDKELIQWRFKSIAGNEYKILYRYGHTEEELAGTYEGKGNATGPTTLKIKTVSTSVAGQYICLDHNGDSACAEVVVFEKDPNCTSNFIQGNQAELCCSVGYWGNVAPHMRFQKESKVLTPNVANISELNQMRTSHVCATVNLTQNGIDYTSEVFLPIDNYCAREWRRPVYSYVWTFQSISLHSSGSEQGDDGRNGVDKTADQPNSRDAGSGNGTAWKWVVGFLGFLAFVLFLAGLVWCIKKCFFSNTESVPNPESDPMNPSVSIKTNVIIVQLKNNGGNTGQQVTNSTGF